MNEIIKAQIQKAGSSNPVTSTKLVQIVKEQTGEVINVSQGETDCGTFEDG